MNDGQYGNDRSWIRKTRGSGWVQIDLRKVATLEAVVWGRDRLDKLRDRLATRYRIEIERGGQWVSVSDSEDRRPYPGPGARLEMPEPSEAKRVAAWHEVRGEINALEAKLQSFTATPMVCAGRFEPASQAFRLNRGDVTQPREEVAPSAVSALGLPLKLPRDLPEQSRRIALAQWLAAPTNPLPSRVLVNRL